MRDDLCTQLVNISTPLYHLQLLYITDLLADFRYPLQQKHNIKVSKTLCAVRYSLV